MCEKLCKDAILFKEGRNKEAYYNLNHIPGYKPECGDCFVKLTDEHYRNRYYATAKCDVNIVDDGQVDRHD